ncbi:FAD-dependent monooxygenase [Variovorax sp. J2P1-59]|uniref:FAD-dependent monooxygenase n=1 Tax=Variovorax flavidus TaxID=3053501 RepID=UPI0025768683|nr:FAD-dependent monooxygenase [Variovorax sp. J2P1-59]MDM0074840.1 FAD-dependent monooxygenase [Variovorax sp. J2P1-59]
MSAHLLIAGGGIGGLCAAVALARAGQKIDVLEQAPKFGEIGAGIQLWPNVTHRLRLLGLEDAIASVAARPEALTIRNAADSAVLARMPLGDSILRKYGSPYLCVHRVELHGVLLAAAQNMPLVTLTTDARISRVVTRRESVSVGASGAREWEGDGLIGADGLWSIVRERVVASTLPPRPTGHTAWRALVPCDSLPAKLRSVDVQAWLAEQLHVVAYPVRGGDWLSLVVIAESELTGSDPSDWDQEASAGALLNVIGDRCDGVRPLIDAMPSWRAWTVNSRPPVAGPDEMANDRIALLGDASHPMAPHLAQGAAMAIEDAVALAECAGDGGPDSLPDAFARYAAARWRRNARVQAQAKRDGDIFHSRGTMRMARDAALRVVGGLWLDAPWLYEG